MYTKFKSSNMEEGNYTMKYKLASTHDEVQNQEICTDQTVIVSNTRYANTLNDAKNLFRKKKYKECFIMLSNLDLKPILKETHLYYTYILFTYEKYLHMALSLVAQKKKRDAEKYFLKAMAYELAYQMCDAEYNIKQLKDNVTYYNIRNIYKERKPIWDNKKILIENIQRITAQSLHDYFWAENNHISESSYSQNFLVLMNTLSAYESYYNELKYLVKEHESDSPCDKIPDFLIKLVDRYLEKLNPDGIRLDNFYERLIENLKENEKESDMNQPYMSNNNPSSKIMNSLNKSIEWMKNNPDEDPSTFAVNHMDYYRANYDCGAKIGQPILKENEIFLNGKTGHFLVVGAKGPFWCTGISEQETKTRIKKNGYLDCLTRMFETQPDIDSKTANIGFINPNKIVQVAAVQKTEYDLGTKDLTSMALRIIAEDDIKFFQGFITKAMKNKEIHIADIEYPKIDITYINIVLEFIDNLNDELIKNHLMPEEIIKAEKKATQVSEMKNFSTEQKIKEIKDRFAPSNVKIAMEISNEGIRAKRTEQFDDAIRYYQEVIRMFPTAGGIYYNLGKLFYIIGDFSRAQKAYVLAYINGANVFDQNLFTHLGHVLMDSDKDNHIVHEYKKDLMGRHGERSPEYDTRCYLYARKHIDSLRKLYERELIQA